MSVPATTDQVEQYAIEVQGLEKSFKHLKVLRGVDIEVARGSIFRCLNDFSRPCTSMAYCST